MAQKKAVALQSRMRSLHVRLEKANTKHRRNILAITDGYQERIRKEHERHAQEVARIRGRDG